MSESSKVRVFDKAGIAARLLDDDDVASVELPVEDLRSNLAAFMGSVRDILPALQAEQDGFGLKTVTIAVGINGKAQVGFLGTGAEVGANATLTLTFTT